MTVTKINMTNSSHTCPAGLMREFNGVEPDLVHDERSRFVRVGFRLDPPED